MSTGGTPPISSSAGSVNAGDSSGSADPENEIIDDKAPLWNFVKKIDKMAGGGSWRWRCNFCKMHYNGSYTRVRGHLLKEGTTGIAACNKVTPHAFAQMSKLVRECKERLMNAAPRQVPLPSSGQQGGSSGTSSYGMSYHAYTQAQTASDGGKKRKTAASSVEKAFQNSAREQCDSEVARMYYTGGLSFNLARNPHYRNSYIRASTLPGYIPPGYNALRTTLLAKERKNIEHHLEPIKITWKDKGVSLCSDGWSDAQRRPLINVIATCESGPMMLRAINCEGEFKDHALIADLIIDSIKEVGWENVVQVITDNAPVCSKAGALIASVARVVLKKGKTQLFKDGSPMVYSGAVDRIIGRPPPRTGDVVLVADGAEKPIGWGMYNSVSMFCVRLMQLDEEAIRDCSCALNMEKLLETRINEAIELRKSLGLPSASTNAFRLVNSEGDRLSGLIIDIFGDVAVIASSAAWVEKYKAEIEACVGRINEINHINWRPSVEILKEEGLDVSNLKEMDPSICPQRTKVMENGIFYAISLEGQKTGFYADQRENRKFISTISDNQKVLDICCYSGGFALNAARGGAVNVTGVDSSLGAIELAKENIALNNMDPGIISFVKEDASEFMKGALSRNESFDIVILDPPKLAPRKKVLQNASGMYRNLNSLAMQLTRKGGLLMTCSCSGAMTQSGTFLRILQSAASAAGRKITVLRDAGAACDHTIDPSYPEGKYLSNILLRVL